MSKCKLSIEVMAKDKDKAIEQAEANAKMILDGHFNNKSEKEFKLKEMRNIGDNPGGNKKFLAVFEFSVKDAEIVEIKEEPKTAKTPKKEKEDKK